jgi:hypothetical protein
MLEKSRSRRDFLWPFVNIRDVFATIERSYHVAILIVYPVFGISIRQKANIFIILVQ